MLVRADRIVNSLSCKAKKNSSRLRAEIRNG
jgi:hypothetical protein